MMAQIVSMSPSPFTFPKQTMHAFVYDRNGENYTSWKEVDVPKVTDELVPLRVLAATFNPIDYKLPTMPGFLLFQGGTTVGQDVAGEVLRDGQGFKKGEKVFGAAKSGAIAEYAVCSPARLVRLPEGVKPVEGSGLFVAGLTSVMALKKAGVEEGSSVLVVGGSGGCGSLGIQLAKFLGAKKVTAVCSGKNADLCKSLGADEIVDYTKESVSDRVPDGSIDAAYDTVTAPEDPDYTSACLKALKPTGGLFAINVSSNWKWAGVALREATGGWVNFFSKQHYPFFLKPTPEYFEVLTKALEQKKLTPQVGFAEKFTEENVRKGYQLLKSRRATGKVGVVMED